MIRNKTDYLTSLEAAEILGFTPDYIRRLIANGIIKATKLGHNWLIKPKDIARISRQRFPREKK